MAGNMLWSLHSACSELIELIAVKVIQHCFTIYFWLLVIYHL